MDYYINTQNHSGKHVNCIFEMKSATLIAFLAPFVAINEACLLFIVTPAPSPPAPSPPAPSPPAPSPPAPSPLVRSSNQGNYGSIKIQASIEC